MGKYKLKKKRQRSKQQKQVKKQQVQKSYSAFRKNIKTGDIVLFSGKSGFSNWIKFFTTSSWSHVAMAFKIPEWDMLLLYESNTLSDVIDVETKTAIHGVQLVPLSERLKQCKGSVAVRQLSKPLTEDMIKKLIKFRRKIGKRPFETDISELFKSAYKGPFGRNKEDLSTLFCSELIAETYQQIGLLEKEPKGLPSNEYTPRDFSSKGRDLLQLLNGYSLGEEILIKV